MKDIAEMSSGQRAAVEELIAQRTGEVGEPIYDSNGEARRTKAPIVEGATLIDAKGQAWANFGGSYWYSIFDYEDEGTGFWIVSRNGNPLGAGSCGPVLLIRKEDDSHQVSLLYNTGWKFKKEIEIDEERRISRSC